MTRPEFLEAHVGVQQPVRGDDDVDVPFSMPSSTALDSLPLRKRDSDSMRTGQSAKRSRKLLVCCSASSVVGTSTATCLPACAATKAARIATFGLAEAHVAADHAVHGLSRWQGPADLADRLGLVGGLFEREAAGEGLVLELLRRQRGAAFAWRCAYRSEQLRGHVADLVGGALARRGPTVVPSLCSGALSGAAPE
jgi:hypothetical protein